LNGEFCFSTVNSGNLQFLYLRLVSQYKKHAARLRKTGEGVQDSQSGTQSQAEGETMDFYIPGEGPDESTPEYALNIWSMCSFIFLFDFCSNKLDEIVDAFPYFTRLHRLYASRPNVVPIVITTGVTRGGPRTVWYQQPDDANIDPFLLAQSSVSTRTFSSDLTNATSTPTLNHTLPATPTPRAPSRMPSLTKTPTPAAGQKRTIVEAMLEMSRYVTIS
jgi:hypothetical protein